MALRCDREVRCDTGAAPATVSGETAATATGSGDSPPGRRRGQIPCFKVGVRRSRATPSTAKRTRAGSASSPVYGVRASSGPADRCLPGSMCRSVARRTASRPACAMPVKPPVTGRRIFSSHPVISDPTQAAGTLVHQLCHAALSSRSHGIAFTRLAIAVGLIRKYRGGAAVRDNDGGRILGSAFECASRA
jgi:hypothetical protein